MRLVVDSGSSKTAWLLGRAGSPDILVESVGINPVRDEASHILSVVQGVAGSLAAALAVDPANLLRPQWGPSLSIYFYGAGCIEPFKEVVERVLAETFTGSRVVVESDLLGAARALCGTSEGIACILGTGSNSCLYDGQSIVANVSPLGWILGDEGSGAVLGRRLVGDALKGCLGNDLRAAFLDRFGLTQGSIIEAVYRKPQANKFLASLVPFLDENRADGRIQELLHRAFCDFFVRNVAKYERPDLPVNFVGGIAYQFEQELRQSAEYEHFIVGRIEKAPIKLMADFHNHASENF